MLLVAGLVPAQPEPDKDLLAPHLEALSAKKKDTRLAAIKKISNQGLAARAAAADLGKRMRDDPDEQVAGQAARALAQIGPGGVPELIEGVRHSKVTIRNRALWALGLMGPDGKEAVDALADALADPEPNLRVMAAYALGEMEAAAKPAVGALCKGLRDKNAKVRAQAALALRTIGADAVPGIQELLKDDDIKVRLEALQAAAQIGADAQAAVADLAELLKDDDAKVRIAAADALWSIGPDAKDAITPLISVMRDKNGHVQQHAFQAILRIGSADVPGLLETMRKLNGEAHWAFPYILRQFGPRAKDAVRPLMKQLESPDGGSRISAVLALGHIGNDARAAVPALQNALKDKNPVVQHSAAFALCRVMADPPDFTKQIHADLANEEGVIVLNSLQDRDPMKRWLAVLVAGKQRMPAEDYLIDLLADPHPAVRLAAHQALMRIGRSTDLGPAANASTKQVQQAQTLWRNWLNTQVEAHPAENTQKRKQ
jgi:HEAT repeat protein